jgi:hypothetical protein
MESLVLKKSYLSQPYFEPNSDKSIHYAHVMINGAIIADIDHNGYLDLVTFPSNFMYDTALDPIVWTNTNGVFSANATVISNIQPYQYFRDSVPGDFNNDGFLDFFQIDPGWELNNRDPMYFYGNQPALLLGGSKGLDWVPVDQWLTNQSGGKTFNHIGASADYDRDGDLDLLVASFWNFRLYENNGSAQFTWNENIFPTAFNNRGNKAPSGATFIQLGDDYAIVSGSYRSWDVSDVALPLSVLTQKNGIFTESYTLERPNLGFGRERNYGAGDMINMDFNGDGREDLLVMWETEPLGGIDDGMSNMSGGQVQRYSDLSNSIVSIYFQDQNGKLTASKEIYNLKETTASGPPLFFEDFNLDGHVDFWTSGWKTRARDVDNLIWINDGTGHFSNPSTKLFQVADEVDGNYLTSPYFFDANNDGAIDLVSMYGVFSANSDRTVGQQIRTFISDRPTYDIDANNKFIVSLTDKLFDGGAGVDTAIFSGKLKDYDISINQINQQITTKDHVAGRDGHDVFVNVERFKFNDVSLAFDVNGNAGQAFRLYKAALDRTPDAQGLGYWIYSLDQNVSLKTIAAGFVSSAEFLNKFYGDGSNATFVTALYNNVLDRIPEQSGYNYWVNSLNQGTSRADVLIGFSESPENYANTVNFISAGATYQEWLG